MSASGGSPRTLRVAVVGAGVMGRHHATNYMTLPQVRLVAVVDVDPEKRAEARRAYGCATYATVEEMLGREVIDAASVAVPTSLHFAVTRMLLDAGVHVLVEKPVATEVAQATALANLSSERGLVLQVGHITRFYGAVQLLAREVKEPYLIEARRLSPSQRVKDVGVVLDLMIHDIDILLGLVHSAVVDVAASGLPLNGSPLEDLAATQIRFENGCVARLLASRVSPDPERTMLIIERDKMVRIDFAKEPYSEVQFFRSPGAARSAGHVTLDRHMVHDENPLRKELEHFLARIESKADPIGTLADDMRSLQLATRILDVMRAPRLVPVH
ncbi:MAG: Gfo/Idh/MocA family oxidoreductase [Trueperaceae bacterium]|nr:Gfo/Idh/MocA family oxidoreductase [Truepera sp.]HRQ09902.1 Gfo/Idh/MocA family oxidoreductase [Trueperaceae bacterium]